VNQTLKDWLGRCKLYQYRSACQDWADAMLFSVTPSATSYDYYHKPETDLYQADDEHTYCGGAGGIEYEAKQVSHIPAIRHTSSNSLYAASNHQSCIRANGNAGFEGCSATLVYPERPMCLSPRDNQLA
jgi:hypothetical protein